MDKLTKIFRVLLTVVGILILISILQLPIPYKPNTNKGGILLIGFVTVMMFICIMWD